MNSDNIMLIRSWISRASLVLILITFFLLPFPTVLAVAIFFIGKLIIKEKKSLKKIYLLFGVAVFVFFNILGIFIKSAYEIPIFNIIYLLKETGLFQEIDYMNLLTSWIFPPISTYGISFLVVAVCSFLYKSTSDIMIDRKKKEQMKYVKTMKDNKGNINLEAKGHVFAVGTTGSGKTANVLRYVEKAFKDNSFMTVIDGKGDLTDFSMFDVITKLAKKYDRKIYLINQSDLLNTNSYNPFKNATPTEIKDMLTSLTEWSEPHYKYLAGRYWQTMATVLKELNFEPNFKRLIRFSYPQNLIDLVEDAHTTNSIDLNLYDNVMELTNGESGKHAQEASNRFAVVAEGDGKALFESTNDDFNITKAYEENAVVLVLLNDFRYGDFARSTGKLVLEDIKNLVYKLETDNIQKPYDTGDTPLFVFDEISVYVDTDIISMLSRSRSAGVKTIVATQNIADIDMINPNLTKQILENCQNYIVMKLNEDEGANKMANVLGTHKTVSKTMRTSSGFLTGESSNRDVEEFKVHPNDIKQLQENTGFYYQKSDNKNGEVIKFNTIFVDV